MAADGSFGTDDDNLLVITLTGGAVCPGFDHAHNRNTGCLDDFVERESRGCVAGDYQGLCTLLLEIVGCADSVPGHGFCGL